MKKGWILVAAALLACGTASAHAATPSEDAKPCAAYSIAQVLTRGAGTVAGSVPVLFVHGITSRPDMWTQGSGAIAYQAAAVPGVTAWTFDYSSAPLAWVDDPRIGPRLADAISCLAQKSGHPVMVVAHSMGGLATQYALSRNDVYGGTVAIHVSEVMTIGTPFEGSALASLAQGAIAYATGLVAVSNAAAAATLQWLLSACAGYAVRENADNLCRLLAVLRSPLGADLAYHSPAIAKLPAWPSAVPVLAVAGDIRVRLSFASALVAADLGDVAVTPNSALAVDTAAESVTDRCVLTNADPRAIFSADCYHLRLASDPTVIAAVLGQVRASVDTGAPCPGAGASSTAPQATPPPGWSILPGTQVTHGADPGGICLSYGNPYWGGITFPAPRGANDYTVTARGRLTEGDEGWGVAARASVDSSGDVTGHAIQYDPGAGGYRDVDYPGDTGLAYPGTLNTAWHTLAITVDQNHYTLFVDGAQVSGGVLPQPGESAGDAFIRVWNGSTVEIENPTVSVH